VHFSYWLYGPRTVRPGEGDVAAMTESKVPKYMTCNASVWVSKSCSVISSSFRVSRPLNSSSMGRYNESASCWKILAIANSMAWVLLLAIAAQVGLLRIVEVVIGDCSLDIVANRCGVGALVDDQSGCYRR